MQLWWTLGTSVSRRSLSSRRNLQQIDLVTMRDSGHGLLNIVIRRDRLDLNMTEKQAFVCRFAVDTPFQLFSNLYEFHSVERLLLFFATSIAKLISGCASFNVARNTYRKISPLSIQTLQFSCMVIC